MYAGARSDNYGGRLRRCNFELGPVPTEQNSQALLDCVFSSEILKKCSLTLQTDLYY